MEKFLQFFSFVDPNIRYVVIGSILLTASTAAVGCFSFLRKRALTGDAVAHAVLPGVCLSFMLAGNKNPYVLLVGAFITGWLSLVVMDVITRKSKIKEDTAIGLVLSVFFGIGILLLTSIQHSGNPEQAGLDSFLFGKAAALIGTDVYVFGTVGFLLIATIIIFYKEFILLSFDEHFAKSIGFPVRLLELLLTTLTVLAVVIGIQAVGVVLMAAMLITPAAAARFWTHHAKYMIIIAAIAGIFSGIFGAYISYLSPAMPTGPWIVMVISIFALGSFFFAPQRGILSRYLRQRKNRFQIMEENIMKVLFHLGEKDKDFHQGWTMADMIEKRNMLPAQLKTGLKRLFRHGYVTKAKDAWTLTKEGKDHGQRITRLHRLWEMYLTEYLKLAPDHVHEDAETIEHIITPELEAKIEEQLQYPLKDPHDSDIPDKK